MSQSSLILPPGSTLGGFEIEDVLGVGGMAVVYRAVQKSLNRRVALKVLNPRLAADSTFRERFRREGALVATLDHPGVVPVYDSGEADGRLYLAMRLIDGQTLAEHMEHGLSVADALPILAAVAGALDAAHEAGLLHRDVKPQNILISTAGRVYLADFGVAKGAGVSNLTATQGFLGSVNYVAPEQIRGGDVGPGADVYALAVVAYECLTGRTPFARDTEAAVIHAHLSDDPPVLAPAGDKWSIAASKALATGLAKDPAKRDESAGVFVQGIDRALSWAPAEVLTRVPGFPPAGSTPEPTSHSEIGAAAGLDPEPVAAPSGLARIAPSGGAGVSAGQRAAPAATAGGTAAPAGRAERPALQPDEYETAGHTVHDRQRSEFVPELAPRTAADKLFSRGPWVILAIAIAVPVGVAALTGDKPVARVAVGPATTLPIAKWASHAVKRPAPASTGGLLLDDATQFVSPDRKSSVTAGVLNGASGLAPVTLGKGEKATRLRVAGGTLREWQAPEKGGVERVAVAATPAGGLAVVCHGPAAPSGAACDHVLGALTADHGALAGDPDPAVASAVAAALKQGSTARKIVLPVKDRTARAADARKIATAYDGAAAHVQTVLEARPWDRDLTRLVSGLQSTSRAYTSFQKAAAAKDRSRDARARTVLRNADASVATALGRLARRGYTVKGTS